MMKVYQNVQFKTLDGIYLRGRLYAAAQRGPAVILCPGVRSCSCVESMVVSYSLLSIPLSLQWISIIRL